MMFGLVLGLLVAAGVYFSGVRSGSPAGPSRPAAADARPAATEPSPAPARQTAASGGARSDASEPDTSAEARFEFYELLPQYEVVIPEVESVAGPGPAEAPPAEVTAPGSYVLQVGSFRSHTDADRRQASLALLGIESRIQRVTIDDDEFHRVRVGPIADLDELNRIRADLKRAGVESLTMKVND